MELKLTREDTLKRLLRSYEAYYDITMIEDGQPYLKALCEFYEHNQKYVISKKAELWSADGEEFLYLFEVPHLTEEIYSQCKTYAYEDGMKRLHVGPGHMYSYITAVFVCDSCTADAAAALKKSRIHKSFHFSLHGWMDYRTVVVSGENGKIEGNRAGHCVVKIMKKVLYSKSKKGEILL